MRQRAAALFFALLSTDALAQQGQAADMHVQDDGTRIAGTAALGAVTCTAAPNASAAISGNVVTSGSVDSVILSVSVDGEARVPAGVLGPQDLEHSGRYKTADYTIAVGVGPGTHSVVVCFTQSGAQGREPKEACAPALAVSTDGACTSEPEPTPPPVANAGPDQTIACLSPSESVPVSLDGSGSTSSLDGALAYAWTEGGASIASGERPTVDLAVGDHTLALVVSDAAGSSAPDEVSIHLMADVTAPVVTLNGSSSEIAECGFPWADSGATAVDECSGDITSRITTQGNVDTRSTGTYGVTYSAADNVGNVGSAGRSVSVVDTIAPAVSVVGPSPIVLECGSGPYLDPGAVATDICNGDLTGAIRSASNVDTAHVGLYGVQYAVADGAGNQSSASRIVGVQDTLAPVVTPGPAIAIWPPNHGYRDFTLADCAQSAIDQCEGPLDVNAAGAILSIRSDEPEDINGVGDGQTRNDMVITGASSFRVRAERDGRRNGRVYVVRYAVVDGAGNAADAECRISVPHDQDGAPAIDDGAAAGYAIP